MMRSRIVAVAQAAFVLMFVLVTSSNFQLRRELKAARSARPPSPFRSGEVLPAFNARDLGGRAVTLGGSSQQGTVMVLFAPGCRACDVVLDQVAAKPSPNVTVVSLLPRQRAAEEARKVAGKAPVYFVERIQQSSIARRARVVPQILRIGAGGRIDEVCPSYTDCVRGAAGSS